MKFLWIALFSHTGTEIVDIAEAIGEWPTRIITNHRLNMEDTVNVALPKHNRWIIPNRPSEYDYRKAFQLDREDKPLLITLHGWMRIVPPAICDEYEIYNGHPGLINFYPELKGKDPQVRAWESISTGEGMEYAGSVIHRVTPGVDEGPIKMGSMFSTTSIPSFEDFNKTLRLHSLDLWVNFLKHRQ